MKIKFLQILGVAAIAAFSFSSCETDACKDVDCGEYGTCVDGDCVCDTGYEGVNCGTLERAKFLGTYTIGGTSQCTETGNDTYSNVSLVIGESSAAVDRITIVVSGVFNLTATVDGTSFTVIPSTSGAFSFTGSGSINGSNLTFDLTEEDSAMPETCIYAFTGSKQ